MGKTLSTDLRVRVIAAVEAGMSRNAAAARFGIAVATAVRWLRAWHETGATAARPKGGDLRSRRIEAYRDTILGAVAAQVDITLVELAELLKREHGACLLPARSGASSTITAARPLGGGGPRPPLIAQAIPS